MNSEFQFNLKTLDSTAKLLLSFNSLSAFDGIDGWEKEEKEKQTIKRPSERMAYHQLKRLEAMTSCVFPTVDASEVLHSATVLSKRRDDLLQKLNDFVLYHPLFPTEWLSMLMSPFQTLMNSTQLTPPPIIVTFHRSDSLMLWLCPPNRRKEGEKPPIQLGNQFQFQLTCFMKQQREKRVEQRGRHEFTKENYQQNDSQAETHPSKILETSFHRDVLLSLSFSVLWHCLESLSSSPLSSLSSLCSLQQFHLLPQSILFQFLISFAPSPFAKELLREYCQVVQPIHRESIRRKCQRITMEAAVGNNGRMFQTIGTGEEKKETEFQHVTRVVVSPLATDPFLTRHVAIHNQLCWFIGEQLTWEYSILRTLFSSSETSWSNNSNTGDMDSLNLLLCFDGIFNEFYWANLLLINWPALSSTLTTASRWFQFYQCWESLELTLRGRGVWTNALANVFAKQRREYQCNFEQSFIQITLPNLTQCQQELYSITSDPSESLQEIHPVTRSLSEFLLELCRWNLLPFERMKKTDGRSKEIIATTGMEGNQQDLMMVESTVSSLCCDRQRSIHRLSSLLNHPHWLTLFHQYQFLMIQLANWLSSSIETEAIHDNSISFYISNTTHLNQSITTVFRQRPSCTVFEKQIPTQETN